MPLALLQAAQTAAGSHPLAGTAAEWMWLLPILPLVGFVINAGLSLAPVYHAGPADPSHDAEAGHTDMAHEEQYEREAVSFHKRFNTISSILGPLVVALSKLHGGTLGQVFVVFVMTVAAAEAAVGLAIVIAVFRHFGTVDLGNIKLLRG